MAPMPAAEAAIRNRIERDGRITFCQFMEMALYTAPGCYYGSTAAKIGSRGDYFTSPEVHPSFGALLARQLEQLWVSMGRPARFAVVEMGAGTGALARDILSYTARWAPPFHDAIHYAAIERSPTSPGFRKSDPGDPGSPTKNLSDNSPRSHEGTMPDQDKSFVSSRPRVYRIGSKRVVWHGVATFHPEEDSIEGCCLSNELPDSFPVHRVAVVGGELREICVQLQNGRLVETLDEASHPDVIAYFERLGFLPPEGCRAEVNLAALDWMGQVARALRRGAVITLDYGYRAEEMYSRRDCDGTLLCFYRHTLNSDPYARIGQQDMTTHVDFTSLSRQGEDHGLRTVAITSQSTFLSALGIGGYLTTLPRMGLRHRDYEANRMGMLELLKPHGLGRIQVLVQQKGMEGFEPAGLRTEGLWGKELGRDLSLETPPLLTRSHLRLNAPPAMDEPVDAEAMWHELMGGDGD